MREGGAHERYPSQPPTNSEVDRGQYKPSANTNLSRRTQSSTGSNELFSAIKNDALVQWRD